MKSHWRFVVIVALLASTAIFLQARGHKESLPSREPLASLPFHLGPWTGTDVPMQPDVLAILGPGDFLQRFYEKFLLVIVIRKSARDTGDSHQSGSLCRYMATGEPYLELSRRTNISREVLSGWTARSPVHSYFN